MLLVQIFHPDEEDKISFITVDTSFQGNMCSLRRQHGIITVVHFEAK